MTIQQLAVHVGEEAPDFTLPSTSGDSVTLSDHRDRSAVLLAFFPLAFTSTCTDQLCRFSEELSRFTSARTTVYGISVDSVPTLQAFRRSRDMSVELLSDFKRDVCRRYGTLLEEPFFSCRAYVIVDPAGVVRWTFVERNLGNRRENAELLGKLEDLR